MPSTILIVDDNLVNINLLVHLLSHSGFDIKMAQSGEMAIEQLQQELVDLILLDAMMPGIDGFQTCSILKENPDTASIPIIFMTALDQSENKLRGLNLGAVDYITKPFNQDEVLARIRLHLQLHQLNQKLQKEVRDRMTAELQLQTLNTDLERRVHKQTAALKQTMLQLQQTYSQLLAREKQLEYDVCHDALTGLPNRVWLMNRLQQLIQVTEKGGMPYILLFIDLDRFKIINDSLGHLIGDQLLKSVGKAIEACLQETDTVVRLGGDEFVILMENVQDIGVATNLAEKIQHKLQVGFQLKQYQVQTGASIGIAMSSKDYQQPEEVLRDADIAMYYAKAKGRGCYEVLTSVMQKQATNRWQLEIDLRQGLEYQEFYLHYQPIVSLRNGELIGFESLLRWSHPTRGLLSPMEFIAISEETGLIHQLGWWALQSSIQQLSIWRQRIPRDKHLIVNINVSPTQLQQTNLPSRIETLINKTNIPKSDIKLELTESALIDSDDRGITVLNELKKMGVNICIDDFGTGYSSLSRLHEMPVDTLKIDKSFVQRLGTTNCSRSIIQTIVTIAKSLGMSVVAEGIETPAQKLELQALGCDFGQGYLFSRPLDVRAATERVMTAFNKQQSA
ncbi:MAG: EAL domain-containing protein [Coleofasciculaceae cyanobacterium SM2_1_6]|nr:EAL domain-containing protein [Coleofasciculaceae cyanobacterium SM2_1_6]